MTIKRKTNREISTSRKLALNIGARIQFAIKFTIGLAALLWASGCLYLGVDSSAWPSTAATIVYVNQDGSDLLYTYSVSGIKYNGTLIRYGDTKLANSYKKLEESLKSGTKITAKYNPDSHSMSCLLTGYHKSGVYVPLAIGFFLISIAGLELRARYRIR